MTIREGRPHDIPNLVSLDHAAYGAYGADKNYFLQKFHSRNAKIIVSEADGRITGFVVFEVMEPNQELEGFFDMSVTKPITEKWMHIIAFTTVSNFKDIQSDSALLQAAEDEAKRLGCTRFCVPLSIDHPYVNNDVFGFWEKNAYHNAGTITWIASPLKTIDCYFYTRNSNKL